VTRTAWARGSALGVVAVSLFGAGCTLEPRPGDDEASPPAQVPDREPLEYITPEGVARLPVFTPAVRVGDLLFLSGAIGTVGTSLEVVDGGVAAETRQTLENIRSVLTAAGADFDDLVKCTVFLADIDDYAAMNEAYVTFFPSNPPARSAMAGSGLALGAKVEIECIARAAARPDEPRPQIR